MNDSMMQEILKRLDVLAEQLGAGAAAMWAALVKQAMVDGATSLVWVLVVGGIAIFLARRGRNNSQRLKDHEDEDSDVYLSQDEVNDLKTGRGFAYTGAVIAGLIATGLLTSAIAHLVNPQYYALVRLGRMMTGN